MANENTNPAEQDYAELSSWAERLGLEDDQKDKFINSSMKRLGYKPRTQWEPPEPENGGDNNDDGDFFSGGGKPRERRQVRDDRSGGGGKGGGSWQYDD